MGFVSGLFSKLGRGKAARTAPTSTSKATGAEKQEKKKAIPLQYWQKDEHGQKGAAYGLRDRPRLDDTSDEEEEDDDEEEEGAFAEEGTGGGGVFRPVLDPEYGPDYSASNGPERKTPPTGRSKKEKPNGSNPKSQACVVS